MPTKINPLDDIRAGEPSPDAGPALDPSSPRPQTVRELLVAARARLGDAALQLKTREELQAALGQDAGVPGPEVAASRPPIVVSDFFVRRSP